MAALGILVAEHYSYMFPSRLSPSHAHTGWAHVRARRQPLAGAAVRQLSRCADDDVAAVFYGDAPAFTAFVVAVM